MKQLYNIVRLPSIWSHISFNMGLYFPQYGGKVPFNTELYGVILLHIHVKIQYINVMFFFELKKPNKSEANI